MSRLFSSRFAFAFLIFTLAASARSKDPVRERGVLAEMQSISCGYMQKTGSTVAGVLITGAQHTKSRELLCQEYVLKTPRVTYRIRPKEDKHPVLLRVGDEAEFRLKKDEMLLRVPDGDNKEREYIVVSMTASPDFTAELNQTQPPPKPHGPKLKVDSDDQTTVGSRPGSSEQGALTASSSARVPQRSPSGDAAPANPSLKIDSTPSGAEVFIDSSSAGHTPALINVSPGTHSVQVVMPGYKDWVANVNIAPSSHEDVTVTLSRL